MLTTPQAASVFVSRSLWTLISPIFYLPSDLRRLRCYYLLFHMFWGTTVFCCFANLDVAWRQFYWLHFMLHRRKICSLVCLLRMNLKSIDRLKNISLKRSSIFDWHKHRSNHKNLKLNSASYLGQNYTNWPKPKLSKPCTVGSRQRIDLHWCINKYILKFAVDREQWKYRGEAFAQQWDRIDW